MVLSFKLLNIFKKMSNYGGEYRKLNPIKSNEARQNSEEIKRQIVEENEK